MVVIKPGDLIAKFRGFKEAGDGYIWGTAGAMWTSAKQKAATREQTVKYGAQWIGHRVEDCSGAFKRAFNELGGDIYHGSNTMYLRYCTEKGKLKDGKRTDGKELKPGSAVFVWKEEEQKYSHVGLYVGGGAVIEAASTQKGVIQGKVTEKKWSHWGELKGVDYSSGDGSAQQVNTDDTPGEYTPTRPTLRKGDKGEAVRVLQTMLLEANYDVGSWCADGIFGKATEAAVKHFQEEHFLEVDGVVGKKTWAALDAATAESGGTVETGTGGLYTVTVHGLTETEAQALAGMYTDVTVEREG